MNIACIQLNSSNEVEKNVAQAEALIRQAAGQGAQLIALPENAFFMRASDAEGATPHSEAEHPGIQRCEALAKELGCWILVGSVAIPCVEEDGKWFNRSLLVNDQGEIVARYDKIHLFDAMISSDRAYRESARVKPGDRAAIAKTPWGKLGMTICYDLRFPHLYRQLAKAGCNIIAIPAAFTQRTGEAHWHVLLRARAIETGAFILAPAQCGTHPGGRKTYGHSLMVDPWGTVIAERKEDTPGILTATLDLNKVDEVRRSLPSLTHDRKYLPPPEFEI